MANIQKARALVLKTWKFRETSMLCSVLSKPHGKLKVMAKGARRPTSKFCGSLEQFSVDDIIFYHKEDREIDTLSDAVVVEAFAPIRTSIKKYKAALVLCEFLDKVAPQAESDARLYGHAVSFLHALAAGEENAARRNLYAYLLIALADAGVKPHLRDCVRCHEPAADTFSLAAGGIVCDRDFDATVINLDPATRALIGGVYAGRGALPSFESYAVIKNFITRYLYHHLDGLVLNSLKYV